MNKRILLNVIIFALLTFYMIFNIVYEQLIDKHEPATPQVEVTNIWEEPFMVPRDWQLIRLELPSITLQKDSQGLWISVNKTIDLNEAATMAASWQNLQPTEITIYQNLPLEGSIALAFVAEDPQPLIFRIVKDSEKIHFYRMIDKKRFTFSIASKIDLLSE